MTVPRDGVLFVKCNTKHSYEFQKLSQQCLNVWKKKQDADIDYLLFVLKEQVIKMASHTLQSKLPSSKQRLTISGFMKVSFQ